MHVYATWSMWTQSISSLGASTSSSPGTYTARQRRCYVRSWPLNVHASCMNADTPWSLLEVQLVPGTANMWLCINSIHAHRLQCSVNGSVGNHSLDNMYLIQAFNVC